MQWISGKLSDLVEINPSVKLHKGDCYPFVSMDVIKPYNKQVEPKEAREYTGGGARFREFDTLFARITPCLENGKISQVRNLEGGVGFGSTEFLILRGKHGISDTDFVYYLSISEPFRTKAIQLMVGTSGRQRVDHKALSEEMFTIPPLQIQKQIAEILSSFDEKIELNRRMNETLEQMAMALYKNWFREGNEEQKISDLIDISPSISVKKDFPTSFVEMKALPVDSMSVSDDDIVIKPFTSGSKFMNDDILFARITPCLENGKTAYVDFLEEGQAGFGSTEFLVFRAKENCCPQYVYCLSRDSEFRAYAIKSMVGTSGRQRVQTSSISEYLVAKPDPELMKRFDETTKDWFYQIRSNTKEIVDLKKVRDYLLPRLLSGEIEVKAAEEQVEEVLAGG